MILSSIIRTTDTGWRAEAQFVDGRYVVVLARTVEAVCAGLDSAVRDMSGPHEKVLFEGECE